MRNFYVKHRTCLEADGVDATACLREFIGQAKVYGKAVEAEDKAMEEYLLAGAHQADLTTQLTEYEFKMLKYVDGMSEAHWAAIPPEHQKEIRAASDNVRNAMPEYLAALPIEKRRQLEGVQ